MWGGESEEEGEGDCEAPHGEVRLREPGVTSTIYTDQAGCGFGQTTRAGHLSVQNMLVIPGPWFYIQAKRG